MGPGFGPEKSPDGDHHHAAPLNALTAFFPSPSFFPIFFPRVLSQEVLLTVGPGFGPEQSPDGDHHHAAAPKRHKKGQKGQGIRPPVAVTKVGGPPS